MKSLLMLFVIVQAIITIGACINVTVDSLNSSNVFGFFMLIVGVLAPFCNLLVLRYVYEAK